MLGPADERSGEGNQEGPGDRQAALRAEVDHEEGAVHLRLLGLRQDNFPQAFDGTCHPSPFRRIARPLAGVQEHAEATVGT